ncbi:hypothetical protein BS50DRAFT_655734 [Corynespora cassiicola Philippines]|uniref:Uncharacterized protein n=1 Tax=Corynespora cassiicola Philippines TaxID=1448308 RepID=A0A2T2N4J5_CORCC|nr:hypothetical protein BS50DRAFT_655734 [Corynespora cassiicola Philippines]
MSGIACFPNRSYHPYDEDVTGAKETSTKCLFLDLLPPEIRLMIYEQHIEYRRARVPIVKARIVWTVGFTVPSGLARANRQIHGEITHLISTMRKQRSEKESIFFFKESLLWQGVVMSIWEAIAETRDMISAKLEKQARVNIYNLQISMDGIVRHSMENIYFNLRITSDKPEYNGRQYSSEVPLFARFLEKMLLRLYYQNLYIYLDQSFLELLIAEIQTVNTLWADRLKFFIHDMLLLKIIAEFRGYSLSPFTFSILYDSKARPQDLEFLQNWLHLTTNNVTWREISEEEKDVYAKFA